MAFRVLPPEFIKSPYSLMLLLLWSKAALCLEHLAMLPKAAWKREIDSWGLVHSPSHVLTVWKKKDHSAAAQASKRVSRLQVAVTKSGSFGKVLFCFVPLWLHSLLCLFPHIPVLPWWLTAPVLRSLRSGFQGVKRWDLFVGGGSMLQTNGPAPGALPARCHFVVSPAGALLTSEKQGTLCQRLECGTAAHGARGRGPNRAKGLRIRSLTQLRPELGRRDSGVRSPSRARGSPGLLPVKQSEWVHLVEAGVVQSRTGFHSWVLKNQEIPQKSF